MGASRFEDLKHHVGHNIECVFYGDPPKNVAVECLTCNEVLMDFNAPGEPVRVQLNSYRVPLCPYCGSRIKARVDAEYIGYAEGVGGDWEYSLFDCNYEGSQIVGWHCSGCFMDFEELEESNER